MQEGIQAGREAGRQREYERTSKGGMARYAYKSVRRQKRAEVRRRGKHIVRHTN